MTAEMKQYEQQIELLEALRNNEELNRLVVGGYHNLVARQTADLPRIVYSEIRNTEDDFAENKLKMAVVNFQISIFTDEKTIIHQTAITKEVAKLMSGLGYRKYDDQPLYEEDTKLYHRAMRFTKNVHL
jgi:hypothetical protein